MAMIHLPKINVIDDVFKGHIGDTCSVMKVKHVEESHDLTLRDYEVLTREHIQGGK